MKEPSSRVIFILALLVGLIYLSPHLIYLYSNPSYNPLLLEVVGPDETIYAAGAQEVLEGKFVPSDVTTYEHKQAPFFYAPFPFWVMAALAKGTGGVYNALIFSDFIFGMLAFVLFYYLSKLLLKNKHLSVIAALVLVFFYRLFIPTFPLSLSGIGEHVVRNLFYTFGEPIHFWFARFVHPQISTALFLLTLILLYISLQKNKWSYYFIAGIAFALNVYSYFYSWTFLVVFLGLLFLFFLWQKEKDHWQGLLISAAVGFLLAIPYLVNLWALQAYDLTARSGLEMGRFIEGISLVYLLLLLLFYLFFRTKTAEFSFLALLLVSAIVVLNLQLVFGYTIQNGHWNSRVIVPILILILLYCCKELYPKLKSFLSPKWNFRRLSWSIIILLFLLAASLQIQEAVSLKDKFGFSPAQVELLQWMQDNIPSEEVVLSSDLSWNLWIPAYTLANVYFPYAAATVASDDEIKERFILTFKLLNKSNEEVQRQLRANSPYTRYTDPSRESDVSYDSFLKSFIFVDRIYPIQHRGLLKQYTYDPTLVEQLIQEYNRYPFVPENVHTYRVDYVLLLKEEKPLLSGLLRELPAEIVFENEEFAVIKGI